MDNLSDVEYLISTGDSMDGHGGMKFSTFDKDQDAYGDGNCAKLYLGAFWYGACHYANPNGVYRWEADTTPFAVGVEWYHFKGYNYSMKTFSMKIRRRSVVKDQQKMQQY